MADSNDFQRRVQRIGELVGDAERIGDPAAKSAAKELVQLLMDLHGSGLERILEIVFRSPESGAKLIDEFGEDPLVSSLLILYGLHPDDLRTRVERKLVQAASKLSKMGVVANLVDAEGGNLRVRVEVTGHLCGSSHRTVQSAVEEVIYDAAPDLNSLVIEGLEEPSPSAFVALDALVGSHGRPTMHQGVERQAEGMD